MDNQNETTAGTLDSIAENLKSGISSAPESIFRGDTKRAASAVAGRVGDVANDVVDLASATSSAAKKGASDIGKAASGAKSRAIDDAKEIASNTAGEAANLSSAIGNTANDGMARLKDNVVNNPLKSVAIAATFGYLAAIVLRASQ